MDDTRVVSVYGANRTHDDSLSVSVFGYEGRRCGYLIDNYIVEHVAYIPQHMSIYHTSSIIYHSRVMKREDKKEEEKEEEGDWVVQ